MIKKTTVKTIQNLKNRNEKIAVLTAYDYSTAKYIDEAGADIVLVGENPGSKFDKAKKLGIYIMSEEEFVSHLK